MPHTKIQAYVDIYQFPVDVSPANENVEVTIGDLHGNAMKLMFMLVKQGIAHIDKTNYDMLVKIYTKQVNELTPQNIETFNKILNGIKFKKAAIRLIGDELADRGSNDYFTLKILQRLQESEVPVEIIISNHSIEFLEACEMHQEKNHFHPPMLNIMHASSLENLNTLVEKGLILASEVLDIAQKAYKPNLKAISYTLNEDNSEMTIYSHAGIGLNIVKGLAEQFGVVYQDATTIELAKTINEINSKFQEYVQNSSVNTLCPAEAMHSGYVGYTDLTKTPLVCAIWNRCYDLMERPTNQKGYNLVYVHGHDRDDPLQDQPNVHNLDENNDLGKFIHLNNGAYVVLCTARHSPVLDENLDEKKLAPPTTMTLGQLQKSFEKQLAEIIEKAKNLRQEGHNAAADAALELHQTLSSSYTHTFPNNVALFKQECKTAINKAQSQLENHRGWGLVLSYLAATITGIGALVVIADIGYNLATKKHFSFFKTDTAKKVCNLEKTLDEVPVLI